MLKINFKLTIQRISLKTHHITKFCKISREKKLYLRVKRETVFEEFWIPVHVDRIKKLHKALPIDPENTYRKIKSNG